MELVLTEIRMAARDTNLYTFERADKGTLPGAEPGAHIGVILPNGIERQYSLTHSGPSLTRYTVGADKINRAMPAAEACRNLVKVLNDTKKAVAG